jgi:hypothetical protein
MAAPGPPVAGSVSTLSTTATCAPTLPAVVANDVVFVWTVSHNPVSPTTTFTWPANYTQAFAVDIFDASSVKLGMIGGGWHRATGSESGSITITRDGDTGNDTAFMANCCRIPGCILSGTPFETPVTNNPAASTTGNFPAVTTTAAETCIITGILKGGLSGNYATPTNWTALASNQSTSGTDVGMDVDYRQVTSAGTYDPANVTLTTDADTAWGAFQIAFIPPVAAATTPPFYEPVRRQHHLLRR